MKMYIPKGNRFTEFEVAEEDGVLKISDSKQQHTIDLKALDRNLFSVLIDNQSHLIEAIQRDKNIQVILNQHQYVVPVLNEREKIEAEIIGESESLASIGEIRAPMPGLILRMEVEKGDTVQTGQPLIIMEAMKMENEIRSQVDGEIQEILVKENQKVEKNDLLLKIH